MAKEDRRYELDLMDRTQLDSIAKTHGPLELAQLRALFDEPSWEKIRKEVALLETGSECYAGQDAAFDYTITRTR